MASFLPPSGDQIRDLSAIITMIKAASDKDVQKVITDMKEQVDAAVLAQQEAARLRTEAATDLAAANSIAAENKAKEAEIARRRKDMDEASVSLGDRLRQLDTDVAAFDKTRSATVAELATRARELDDRATAITKLAAEVEANGAKAEALAQEYTEKMKALRQLTG